MVGRFVEEAVSPAEESIDLVEFNLALPGRIEKGSLTFFDGLEARVQ